MVENSYQNFNNKNNNESKQNFLEYNNGLNNILLIIKKISILLRTQLLRSIEKSHNTNRNKKRLNFLSYFENCNDIFEINYDSTKTMTNKDKNKINIDYNDAKKNQIKKRKNNLIGNNTILRNYIIFTLIRSIILNIFSQNILFDLFKFQDSKITLRIKGIGESILFGNITKYSFQNINHLKEVSINGNKQDTIEYKYDFNETDNFVELIWDDNVNNCQNMFYKCSNITEIDLSNLILLKLLI